MSIRKLGMVTVLIATISAAACASTRTQQAPGEVIVVLAEGGEPRLVVLGDERVAQGEAHGASLTS